MTDDASKIARMEARLDGHEALCTERWRELRDGVAAMRASQISNHHDNSQRLASIESTISSARGGWKVITIAAAAGAAIVATVLKALPWLGVMR